VDACFIVDVFGENALIAVLPVDCDTIAAPREGRNASRLGQDGGPDLIAESRHGVGRRTNETDFGRGFAEEFRKLRLFGSVTPAVRKRKRKNGKRKFLVKR
jgi:hypothetical protein